MGADTVFIIFNMHDASQQEGSYKGNAVDAPLLELQTSFSLETNEIWSSPFLETVQIHDPPPTVFTDLMIM
jgi:hypothetical protein